MFRKTDAEILTAVDGGQAVALCQEHSFDLILMDCRMPVMDGFEATVRIREQLRRQGQPGTVIIALTADATKAAELKCAEVGMDGYLLKPLDTTELQKVLRAQLPDFDLTLPVLQQEIREDGPDAGNPQPVVDLECLASLGRNIGNIQPVIRVFVQLLPGRLADLGQAVADQDSSRIESLAHTLKGSCSQFGAFSLAELCAEAEEMAKKKNLGVIRQQYDRIVRTAGQVREILQDQLD
jgi:CheY-like chemotaxis protein